MVSTFYSILMKMVEQSFQHVLIKGKLLFRIHNFIITLQAYQEELLEILIAIYRWIHQTCSVTIQHHLESINLDTLLKYWSIKCYLIQVLVNQQV